MLRGLFPQALEQKRFPQGLTQQVVIQGIGHGDGTIGHGPPRELPWPPILPPPGAAMLRALVFTLTLLSALPVHAEGKHFLWRVSKGGDPLYLAGSVHVLRPSDYPLPAVMEQAFSGSAGLVEEIDLADLDAEAMQMQMLQTGAYHDGRSLKSALPPGLYQKLAKTAAADGLDMGVLDGLKPWLVSLMLLDAGLAKSGYKPADGADMHFATEAKAGHKPVIGLEQPQYQIGLFAALREQDQVALVQQTLDEGAT